MPHRITEILTQHKGLVDALILPSVVVLVGLSAFGLGRLSVTGAPGLDEPKAHTQSATVYDAGEQPAASVKAPIPAKAAPAAPVGESSGQFVASKSGSKYYLPSCGGVSRIKDDNKVWFDTAKEAQAAGYSPAANCPGL